MSKFGHVEDPDLKAYLEAEEPKVDFNTVANILDYSERCINNDYAHIHVDYKVLERREELLEEAEQSFGWRDLKGTHKTLRKLWSV